MARYRAKINTDSYKCKRCSKKNWEPGTMNDYMLAINGITRTIYTKRELIWQLELFRGQSFLLSEYDSNNPEENLGLSNRYVKFLKKNTIKYYDRLCGFERQQYLSGYGFMQGYFDIDKVLDLLKKEGSVKVPFSWLYDIRQYDKYPYGKPQTDEVARGSGNREYGCRRLREKLPNFSGVSFLEPGIPVIE